MCRSRPRRVGTSPAALHVAAHGMCLRLCLSLRRSSLLFSPSPEETKRFSVFSWGEGCLRRTNTPNFPSRLWPPSAFSWRRRTRFPPLTLATESPDENTRNLAWRRHAEQRCSSFIFLPAMFLPSEAARTVWAFRSGLAADKRQKHGRHKK